MDDMILVWNMETGMYDVSSIVFNDTEVKQVSEVITVHFSDGTSVEVVSEHGFFDLNLKKFVYIDSENYKNYIGHSYVKYKQNGWDVVKLVSVDISYKEIKVYSPVTFVHLNYYVNGMLSMPGGIYGLFNIFEVDTKKMIYDPISMRQDIMNYGLLSYEYYEDMIPEIMYDAFNGKYLGIAIKKGILDWEAIEYMANRYIGIVLESNDVDL